MRTLVIGAALVTLIASPAFAQSYGAFDGSPLVAPNATDSAGPYAYEPAPAPEHPALVRHSRVRHHVKQVQRDDTQN
jgi:hypothetical protein